MVEMAELSPHELATFCRQFASMMAAQVDLLQIVSTLREQSRNSHLNQILETLREDLEYGRSLAGSLSRFPHTFSPFFLNMVRQGELEGVLEKVFMQLAESVEQGYHDLAGVPTSSPQTIVELNLDVAIEKLRPLLLWISLVASVLSLGIAGIWGLSVHGWLASESLGPNVFLLVGIMSLVAGLVFWRWRPPLLERCTVCGAVERPERQLIPLDGGRSVCEICIRQSVLQLSRVEKVRAAQKEVARMAASEQGQEAEKTSSPQEEVSPPPQ